MRLDVFARGDGRVYDIEMQVARERDLGRRMRYYQAAMDVGELGSGEDFDALVGVFNEDREWVDRVLTYEQETEMRCRKAREEGREEGEARLAVLVGALLADGRSEDVAAAVEDKVRREELYAELGI